jgi:hypothetical protein
MECVMRQAAEVIPVKQQREEAMQMDSVYTSPPFMQGRYTAMQNADSHLRLRSVHCSALLFYHAPTEQRVLVGWQSVSQV